ncbi:MAG: response regulator transcription factor [Prevotella sp.]|nr:response regulator transcription factor [Prevotella sp.]
MPHFSIAIVEPNTLTALGLQQLLLDMIPMIKVRLFRDFCELESADDGLFAHYFVSSRIFFEHASYFHAPSRRAIVLTTGETAVSGVPTLNVCQSEAMLAKALMMLHHRGHQHNHTAAHCQKRDNGSHQLLTTREEEVAILLAKGNINKEIADRLNISITTVITHRKNIMEKLQARSLADIIIYVVMNGLADIGEL